MHFFKYVARFWHVCLLLVVLSSCNTTKFLGVDEFLLKKNDLVLLNGKNVANKGKVKYELSTLYKQRTNTKFFFIPREWFYFKGRDARDTSKFDRWVQRVIAEPPAIFDVKLAEATTESMKFYMQYQGYYNARVYYDETVRKKKVRITYYIEPNQRFTIDSVAFFSEDPRIDSVLRHIRDQTYLRPGAPLEGAVYEREKDRITRYLRNHGYAYFLPNYVAPLEADTTVRPAKANLYMEVLAPPGDSLHKVYYVGDITVYLNFDPLREESSLRDSLLAGILLKTPDTTTDVKAQTIVDALYLKRGERYRQEDFDKTNRALSALGIFRFVRIKQEVDSIRPNELDFRIELNLNPKVEVGVDFELNYTNRSTSTAAAGNLIGISVSPSVKNRNLFRGAELLISNLSAGLEVNPTAINDSLFFNTIDLRLQSQLYFPKFLDYFGIWRGLDRLFHRRESDPDEGNYRFYTLLRENAVSRMSASYNFLLLLDFYRYNLFNASYGFDVQRSNTNRYIINHLGIDFLRPFTEQAFDDILDSNPFLERSFGQQLFVSLLFRDFNLLYTSRQNQLGASHYIGAHFEVAGAELWAGNAVYNSLSSNPDTLRIGNTDFAQYMKSELDLRYYRQFGSKRSVAARALLGIALPFGFTSDVPYVKQFFVGGPNSIRAWPARSLGPGGYEDTTFNITSVRNALLFYQTGDIKLEFNIEYRFDLLWRFKGALFLDAGNIWTLSRDPDRCGSQFLFRTPDQPCADGARSRSAPFYKQIALGSGFGIRLDLTYFLLRLDLGVRLRYPFPLRGTDGVAAETDYWTDFSRWRLRDVNFNIGLGYPF